MDKLYKSIPFLIAVIGVFSCQQWIEIPVSNQYLNWLCQASILGIFLFMGYRSRKMPEYRMPWPIVLYLVMVIVSAAYGVIMSEGYWDYKLLISNFLAYSSGIGYYYFTQPSKVAVTLKVWMLFSSVVVWLLLPFMNGECGKFLLPASFLLLFISLFEKKTVALIVGMTIIVLISGSIGDRSSLLRFLFCLMIGVGVSFRRFVTRSMLIVIVSIELVLPFVFLLLGVTGVFNVFQIGDSIGANDIEIENSNDGVGTLGADTRTFIYLEEVTSAINHNYVIQGRSLARGYDSDFFLMSDDETMGRGERGSSEVSILNVFNYFGILGVLVFFILLLKAIIHAFKNSRNKFLLFVSVYLGFRWIWAFVEDTMGFNLNTICLWIALSMCFSPFFTRMSDAEFIKWIRRSVSL